MDVRTVCAQLFEAVSVVFLLVGVLIAPSMAAESEEEYRENLTHITNEIKDCNGELSRTYNELYLLLSSRGRSRLEEAQRAWLPTILSACGSIHSIELGSGEWKREELRGKQCLLEETVRRREKLEAAERLVILQPDKVPEEGIALSWPDHWGRSPEAGGECLLESVEAHHQIEDRLGRNHIYTIACQISDSLYIFMNESGGSGNVLSVLDLTREGEPIVLVRGMPWIDRVLKDKSGVRHLVVGDKGLRYGPYQSDIFVYSARIWEGLAITRLEGVETQIASLECPHAGTCGYKTVSVGKQSYEDKDRDGFEDIVVETVVTTCATNKSKTINKIFIATEDGFREVSSVKSSHEKE
jgi:uncharacterized protein YecT (DUF1311 family)